ncbi:MAG: histidine kinase [Planctomycetota bacterium]
MVQDGARDDAVGEAPPAGLQHTPPPWLGPLGIAVAIAPVLQRAILRPADLPQHLGWWTACIVVFTVADQLAQRGASSRLRLTTLAVATASACVAIWLIPVVYGGAALTAALLVVVAARLHELPPRLALTWIGAQSLVLLAVYVGRWSTEVGSSAAFGFFGFQLIGYAFSRTAAAERRARAELAATRSLLAAAARRAERDQIATDLHDVLGHHLVALQLQLQAAADTHDERHLQQARQLARLLLAEVRGVVDEMQGRDGFDLESALLQLEDTATAPRTEVIVDDRQALRRLHPSAAREVFRAVQEAVTNARKHAAASSLRVEVRDGAIRCSDDGHSWQGELAGRGLSGMAGRCREAGCGFEITRQPGVGTTVTITLPPADDRESTT